MKCSLAPRKRKVRRKPLSELCVHGNVTEDREEKQRELHKHCEDVNTDQEETRDGPEKKELNSSQRKVINNSRMMVERQRSQLT